MLFNQACLLLSQRQQLRSPWLICATVCSLRPNATAVAAVPAAFASQQMWMAVLPTATLAPLASSPCQTAPALTWLHQGPGTAAAASPVLAGWVHHLQFEPAMVGGALQMDSSVGWQRWHWLPNHATQYVHCNMPCCELQQMIITADDETHKPRHCMILTSQGIASNRALQGISRSV
jgi:hypothetical protein